MKLKITAFFALFLILLPVTTHATSFDITNFERRQEGIDQVFSFTIINNKERDVVAEGKLILLNVYDTSPPISLPIDRLEISGGRTAKASVRWRNAPLLGQVRALVVVGAGAGMTSVEEFKFWIFPWIAFIELLGAFFILMALSVIFPRFLKRKKKAVPKGPGPEKSEKLKFEKKRRKEKKSRKKIRRKKYPSGMTGYVVEYGDTVVTVANRFEVTWEDIVHSNHLKPPYPLKPGKEILIPIHDLRRPDDDEDRKDRRQDS